MPKKPTYKELEQRVKELEHKQAEEALCENKYKMLLENLPQKIFLKDENSSYISCNGNYAKDLGIEQDEIVGKSDYDFFTKELAEKYRRDDKRILERGEIEEIEEKYLLDGEERIVQTVKVPLKDEKGKSTSVLGIFWDITYRKKALDMIKQQNEFLNNTMESLTHPFYVIDANNYRYVMANSAAREAGMSTGHTCYALTHGKGEPCGSDEYQCPIDEVKRSKKPVKLEHIHFDKDGNPRNVEVYGYPVFDDDGNVIQMIGYCLDITERKQAEESLRESEGKYRNLAESLSELVYRSNPETLVATYVNRSIERIYGYTPEEWLAEPSLWKDAVHPDDRNRVFPFFEAAIDKREDAAIEYRIVRKDGSIRWVIDCFSWEKNHNGNIVSLNGVISDITEKKMAEEELEKSYEQIRKSREQLRRLSSHLQTISEEERKRISREVHDEVGQALTALKIELSMMKKKVPAETSLIEKNIRLVEGTLRSVKRIVKELRPELLDELGLMAATEVYVKDFQSRSGIECQVVSRYGGEDLDPSISIALFRIIQEGLTNVLRHSGASRIRTRLYKKKGWLILRISDNGKGIDKKNTENTMSTGITGIRERAILLGGTCMIKGMSGIGTALKVSIPLNSQEGV